MSTTTPMEVKKDGLRQTQDGIWKLTLTVHPNDMTNAILQAPMGTRYMAAMVAVGDDEQPVPEAASKAEPLSTLYRKRISVKRFQDFVLKHFNPVSGEDDLPARETADLRLKRAWGFGSSYDLDTSPEAAEAFKRFYTYYRQSTGMEAEER